MLDAYVIDRYIFYKQLKFITISSYNRFHSILKNGFLPFFSQKATQALFLR